MRNERKILARVTEYYLSSDEFNGLPIANLLEELDLEVEELKQTLVYMVERDRVEVLFPETDINPHIRKFQGQSKQNQIEKLRRLSEFPLAHTVVYPTKKRLEKALDRTLYQGRPFSLRLALGEPELSFLVFDLSVLEFYRNDPRYYYTNDDISGTISVHDEFYGSGQMSESDQLLLESFGFAYNSKFDRAVAVFLRYLAGLTPEHQQIWNAKLLAGDYELHPDYFRSSILGEFHEGVSIFDAFREELRMINEISRIIGRPPLFRDEWSGDRKPTDFGFLIRPTLKEFNNFVHLLDKAISENINRDFFQDDVAFEADVLRKDGKVVVRQKGTIQILDEWLQSKFRTPDRKPVEEMISSFKEIRRLRQRPAHALDDNKFDQGYFKEQRELMIRAYNGIRTMRLILANHPRAVGYRVPDHIQSGTIWDR